MGLFGKKKQAAPGAAEQAPDTGKKGKKKSQDGKKRRRRGKSELAKLFKESVFETVRGDFQSNTYFKAGDVCYGMVLTEDLFTQASASDGTRGSFVAYVNNGSIRVYVSEATLEQDYIILIPDATTLDSLQEFLFIKNATLEFVGVGAEGEVEPTGVGFPFEAVAQYAKGPDEFGGNPIPSLAVGDVVLRNGAKKSNHRGIYTQVSEEPEEVASDTAESIEEQPTQALPDAEVSAAVTEQTDAETVEEPAEDTPDSAPVEDESVVEDDFLSEDQMQAQEEVPEGLPSDYDPGYDDYEADTDAYDQGDTVEDLPDDFFEEVGSPEQLSKAVERVFYPDDLGLVVTMDAFNAQFGNAFEGFVPFSEEREGDGYLVDYLNEMSANANTLLLQRRQENIRRLQEEYMTLMSAVCTDIAEKVSLDATTNVHGANYKSVHEAREQQEQEMEDLLSKRHADINAAWQKKIDEEKAAAAAQAAREYTQRHGRQHEAQLTAAKQELKIEIDTAYTDGIRQIMDNRRREASRRLEYGVQTSLAVISAKYRSMLAEEAELYNQYDQKMRDYIEVHRVEEHARTRALQEQLDQKTEAEKVRAEFVSRLDASEAQYSKNVELYETQIKRMEEENAKRLAELRDHYEDQLDRNAKVEADLRESLTHQNDHILEMEKRKDEEYQHQIKALQDALAATDESHDRHIAELERTMKHRGKVTTAIILGVSILMLAAGAIGGAYYNMQSTQQELKDARDAMEKAISEKKQIEESREQQVEQEMQDAKDTASDQTKEQAK